MIINSLFLAARNLKSDNSTSLKPRLGLLPSCCTILWPRTTDLRNSDSSWSFAAGGVEFLQRAILVGFHLSIKGCFPSLAGQMLHMSCWTHPLSSSANWTKSWKLKCASDEIRHKLQWRPNAAKCNLKTGTITIPSHHFWSWGCANFASIQDDPRWSKYPFSFSRCQSWFPAVYRKGVRSLQR